eukprot:2450771-Amphidinium_carterae.1
MPSSMVPAGVPSTKVLCELVNLIKPGTIGKINEAGAPWKDILGKWLALRCSHSSKVESLLHCLTRLCQPLQTMQSAEKWHASESNRSPENSSCIERSPSHSSRSLYLIMWLFRPQLLEHRGSAEDDFLLQLRSRMPHCILIQHLKTYIFCLIWKLNPHERENLNHFLAACRQLGVHEYALFSTNDLYDGKNLTAVVRCVHALGAT